MVAVVFVISLLAFAVYMLIRNEWVYRAQIEAVEWAFSDIETYKERQKLLYSKECHYFSVFFKFWTNPRNELRKHGVGI